MPPTSDDPADTWRVYLGRIIRLESKVTFDMSRRHYAGVVAEIIDNPASAARVEIGKRSTADTERTVGGVTYSYDKGEDPTLQQSRRFAVFVPEDLAGTPPAGRVTLSPRLEIHADGAIRLRGRTAGPGQPDPWSIST